MGTGIKQARQRKADLVREAKANLDAHRPGWQARADAFERDLAAADQELAIAERARELELAMPAAGFAAGRDEERVYFDHKAQARQVANLPKPFASWGEQLQAVRKATLAGAVIDPRLGQIQAAASGMSEAVGSEGGFLVQSDFATDMYKRVYSTGQILPRCRMRQVAGNGLVINGFDETTRANGSRHGGAQAYWQGEAATITGTKPKFRRMEWSLKKITSLYYATDELLQDAVALSDEVDEAFRDELQFKLEDAIVRGNGSGQPLGILNSPATVEVAKETNQAAASICAQNVINMWSRAWAKGRPGSVWLTSQDAEPKLFTMTIGGTAAIPVFTPPGGLSGAPFGTLMGRPVIVCEYADTVGQVGDLILADFDAYQCIDKGPMQAATSMHVKFETAEQTFRLIYRCDGAPLWHAPLNPYKGSNTQSPFVTLAERA